MSIHLQIRLQLILELTLLLGYSVLYSGYLTVDLGLLLVLLPVDLILLSARLAELLLKLVGGDSDLEVAHCELDYLCEDVSLAEATLRVLAQDCKHRLNLVDL